MSTNMNTNMNSKKIILVDDDIDLITQNKIVFEEKGYEVSCAHSGGEALTLLTKKTPDILVIDVMMEHHTAGFSLAREVSELYPRLPIIVLSGDPQKPNWMMQPGNTWNSVRRFLDKPIAPEKLVLVVEEVLK